MTIIFMIVNNINHYIDCVSLVDWSSLKDNDSKNLVDSPNDAAKDSVNDFDSETSWFRFVAELLIIAVSIRLICFLLTEIISSNYWSHSVEYNCALNV
jgi:hypothetical protein